MKFPASARMKVDKLKNRLYVGKQFKYKFIKFNR